MAVKRTVEEELEYIRASLDQLADALSEKRSDITEILGDILSGEFDRDLTGIWHRYITCDIPAGATEVMYDTQSTQFEFWITDVGWKISTEAGVNEAYTD